MRSRARHYPYAADSDCVNRPVRRPTDAEARTALARDLSRTAWGLDEQHVARIRWLPLMDVALDGIDGLAIAQARDWRHVA